MTIKSRCVFLLYLITTCWGDWVQQGPKLVGNGSNHTSQQGRALALTDAGDLFVIGGTAGVWTFVKSGTAWSQQGDILVGSNSTSDSNQGKSIALSSNGDTLAVGGNNDEGGQGAVWVFTRDGDQWKQQGDKLRGSGTVPSTWPINQGEAVALSSDGNILAEGGVGDDNARGAIWIWTRSGGIWKQLIKVCPKDVPLSEFFGSSVALNNNGDILVSGTSNDHPSGKVWVLDSRNTTWDLSIVTQLVGSNGISQGFDVAINGVGDIIASGGPQDNDLQGAVWIFVRTGAKWTQQGPKIVASGVFQLGLSVSLNDDGTILAAGAPSSGDSQSGAIVIFQYQNNSIWKQMSDPLMGDGNDGKQNYQGNSIQLNAKGNTVVEGGYGDNHLAGAAWVFANV